MAPFIQFTGRSHHGSNSGIDIMREFSVEPYEDYIEVVKELQGFVRDGKRFPPARDPYVNVCYCTETRVDFWHEAQPTSSEDLTNKGQRDIREMLEDVKEKPRKGTAGAKVTAHYRPLITAWDEDPGPSGTERWDWLDPTVTPGVRQIQWPNGLFITAEVAGVTATHNVPDTVASPLGITIADVSIRRILVPKIPWDTIMGLANSVNDSKWPEDDHPALSILPQFQAKTLRFVGVDVLNMLDSEGNKWFELVVNFQWINHVTPVLFDLNGFRQTDLPVTWNHVFLNPSIFFIKGETGWYEVFRARDPGDFPMKPPFEIPGAALKGGLLHNSANNFGDLFRISSK